MKFLTGDDTGLVKVVHVEKQKAQGARKQWTRSSMRWLERNSVEKVKGLEQKDAKGMVKHL